LINFYLLKELLVYHGTFFFFFVPFLSRVIADLSTRKPATTEGETKSEINNDDNNPSIFN